jgi:hypothetical protein
MARQPLRPLPDNTQHSQQTDIHALGGIRAHNPSKRAAVDPRLRPRGPWDRRDMYIYICLYECIIVISAVSDTVYTN